MTKKKSERGGASLLKAHSPQQGWVMGWVSWPVSGNVGQGILGKQDKLRRDKAQIENNANTIYPLLIFFYFVLFLRIDNSNKKKVQLKIRLHD